MAFYHDLALGTHPAFWNPGPNTTGEPRPFIGWFERIDAILLLLRRTAAKDAIYGFRTAWLFYVLWLVFYTSSPLLILTLFTRRFIGQYTSLFMLPSARIATESFGSIQVAIFAVCPRSGKFLCMVTNSTQEHLRFQVIELDETNQLYFSRGTFLTWFNKYVLSLQRGAYDTFGTERAISMFCNQGPCSSRSLCRGVEVWASSLPALEANSPSGVWIYRIKLNYVGGDDAPLSCQLLRRYWIITYQSGAVEHVTGDGVIGETPILSQTNSTFQYCSVCTGHQTEDASGLRVYDPAVYMEGEFEFCIPASNSGQNDERFLVPIERFQFEQMNKLE